MSSIFICDGCDDRLDKVRDRYYICYNKPVGDWKFDKQEPITLCLNCLNKNILRTKNTDTYICYSCKSKYYYDKTEYDYFNIKCKKCNSLILKFGSLLHYEKILYKIIENFKIIYEDDEKKKFKIIYKKGFIESSEEKLIFYIFFPSTLKIKIEDSEEYYYFNNEQATNLHKIINIYKEKLIDKKDVQQIEEMSNILNELDKNE